MWPASRHAAERVIAPPALRGIYALVEPQRHADWLDYVDALLRGGIRLFQVRAKGDQLEILIAPAGAVAEDVAEAAEEHSPKHPETAASGKKKKPHHKLTHHIDESTSR